MSDQRKIYEDKIKRLCDVVAYDVADTEFECICEKHDIKINRHSGDENSMGPKRIITAYTIRKRKRSRSE
jgi:hypothetical protein|tara:strand:- start:4820 stop:5029 length:210 start_codon:yes stop_codon:yes gene_type:complete